jgi:molecular chaperone DnaK
VTAALEAMNAAWTAASEDIYKAQADGGANAAGPDAGAHQGGSAANDTVEDAQFEEVK